jgi:hypothetical protein
VFAWVAASELTNQGVSLPGICHVHQHAVERRSRYLDPDHDRGPRALRLCRSERTLPRIRCGCPEGHDLDIQVAELTLDAFQESRPVVARIPDQHPYRAGTQRHRRTRTEDTDPGDHGQEHGPARACPRALSAPGDCRTRSVCHDSAVAHPRCTDPFLHASRGGPQAAREHPRLADPRAVRPMARGVPMPPTGADVNGQDAGAAPPRAHYGEPSGNPSTWHGSRPNGSGFPLPEQRCWPVTTTSIGSCNRRP